MGEHNAEQKHTVVLSDIHLSEAQPTKGVHPLWKVYKRAEHFCDQELSDFLTHIQEQVSGPIELVLNGDIFDFDAVMTLPSPREGIRFSWLEKLRGLDAEEEKSCFKMRSILRDHPIVLRALRDFVIAGHQVVFVIGNHDLELNWPKVQALLLEQLNLSSAEEKQVRFCEWFYVSQGDTLIEHGHQHDDFCQSLDPLYPTVMVGKKERIRIPFGDAAAKFMLNGMGLMNPYVDSSFIKANIWEYLVFFYRDVVRVQPGLVWAWFWGAMTTLFRSVGEGLLPAKRRPGALVKRATEVGAKANVGPEVVLALRDIHPHPAVFRPWKIAQELWLDRLFVLVGIFFGSHQLVSVARFFVNISPWWFLALAALLMPLLVFYARKVPSKLAEGLQGTLKSVPLAAEIAGVKRVIHGHTHVAMHTHLGQTEYLNPGTWSAAFEDTACTKPYAKRCFAWIRPGEEGRDAAIYEWHDGHMTAVAHRSAEKVKERKLRPADVVCETSAA